MQNVILTIIFIVVSITSMYSQYETVVLNYEKSYFGENELLPANKFFMLKGVAGNKASYVTVELYQDDDLEDEPLYSTFWKRNEMNNAPDFNIPINYKLDEGEEYDFYIGYYRAMADREVTEFMNQLNENLETYIKLSLNASDKKLKLVRKERQMISDLNDIVVQGMRNYRTKTINPWPGFSDVVMLQLERIDGAKLKNAPEKIAQQDTTLSARSNYREFLIENTLKSIKSEVATHLNTEMFIIYDDKYIQDYPVEKVDGRYYLAPHVGYGGTVLNSDEFNYASGFYAGLSFPLAAQSKNNFLSRTSINVGAFLGKLEDVDGNKIGGPIFKIPTYASLGYRPFAFIRVQAGVAFLENVDGDVIIPGFDNKVKIAPFVGISAEFNMFFNLEK